MVALGVLIVGESGPEVLPVRLIGEALLFVALALTLITGWDYMKRGFAHMTRAPGE
jgi:cardiolipin synthase